jgi:membrane protein DedA with SNARE-associated domain
MANILGLLIKYKYLILFPVAVLEGPFTSILVGFLASVNIFNIFLAYIILVSGDMVGDSFYYSLGRLSGSSIAKHGARFGVTTEKLETAKKYFSNYHHRALIISKLAYGIGLSGLVAAGALKIPFRKYLKTCFFIALIQSAFLLLIGFLFGHAYLQIGKYLNIYAKIVSAVVLLLIGYFIFYKLKKNFKLKDEK